MRHAADDSGSALFLSVCLSVQRTHYGVQDKKASRTHIRGRRSRRKKRDFSFFSGQKYLRRFFRIWSRTRLLCIFDLLIISWNDDIIIVIVIATVPLFSSVENAQKKQHFLCKAIKKDVKISTLQDHLSGYREYLIQGTRVLLRVVSLALTLSLIHI